MTALTYRAASEGDAVAGRRERQALAASRIITAALSDLLVLQGRPALAVRDGHAAPVLAHLMETDAERFWMALDGERLVGFASGWRRGELSYCGGLFVLPGWQGQGIGRRLFELALAGLPTPGGVTALTSSAANPVSNRLYARHGIYPRFPLLVMTGPLAMWAKQGEIGDMDDAAAASAKRLAGLDAEPLGDGHLDTLREIDHALLGVDRSIDHRWYLHGMSNAGWLFRRGGRLAGYAYLGGDGTEGPGQVGPVAALRAQDQVPMLHYALADLARRGIERATMLVAGPNIVAQRLLWDAGFSFSGATGLLCASRMFGRFDRYLLAGDALM